MAEQATHVSSSPAKAAPAAPIVIVVNDSDRIKGFVCATRSAAGDVVNESLRLKPGANRLSREEYETHQRDLKTDDRVWVLDKSFASLSERDAEALAKQTIDLQLLEAFKSVEKRKRPLEALVEQIKSCSERAFGNGEGPSEEDGDE